MIGYLHGQVVFLTGEYCLLETGGVGYRVFMAAPSLARIEPGAPARLYIHTSVREDAITLYGFFDRAEQELFQQLLTVSGIGPRGALGILSAAAPEEFRLSVLKQDIRALTRLPGIGKKTAERLLLELRDKLGAPADGEVPPAADVPVGTVYEEALAALLSLGYTTGEITPVLKNIAGGHLSAEELVKGVLRAMTRRRQ
jgi:Holliday junction DNA helicase RuvA